MSRIINESTAVVQIDSSGLQNGQYTTIYVSTTTIPGQLVTVFDARGFLSSPQSILLSTTGGASFSNGSYSTLLTQRFSYLTLVSQTTDIWAPVSESPFPYPNEAITYKSLDTETLTTSTLRVSEAVSSLAMAVRNIDSDSTLSVATLLTSTLYINSIARFISSSPLDYRLTINGEGHIHGSTITQGAGSFRGSISTSGDFFNTGNISSKLGTIYVGGDVTTASSIRGQRGNLIYVNALSTFTTAGFVGPVSITSSVTSGNFVFARAASSDNTNGVSMNVMSSITFSETQSIRNRPGYFEFTQLPITVPSSISTNFIAASNSLTTSTLVLQRFGPASTLSLFTMGSTQITNPSGSLSVSSIIGDTLQLGDLRGIKAENSNTLTVNYITLNTQNPGATPFSISYPGGTQTISSFWMISSLGTNGTFNAPRATISTNILVGRDVKTAVLNTVNDTIRNFTTQSVVAIDSAMFSSVNSASIQNVLINNSGGSIIGSRTDAGNTIFCSTIKTDEISTGQGVTLRFSGTNRFSLPVSYISSLTGDSITTSSLFVSKVFAGAPVDYSTINPSTPWLLTSTFQMNTSLFTKTTGLGTYFDELTFIATENQTAYYTLIDPLAQSSIYLSTPYVNTILGTGIPGLPSTTNQVASNSQIGQIVGQPASDSDNTLYIGSGNAGWRVHRLTSTGSVTTIAGNNQYFYGDGKVPFNAAFGPRLAVSITSPGELLITDISNVRIRYTTTDPLVTTVAGTGVSAYRGDGGLAFTAAFSTPTATATDLTGRIFIADTGNQVIRSIVGSTINTYAGTGAIGNTGDGGPANTATLNSPFGLTVDSANNLLFTDLSNCAIRRISPSGTIVRIAGTYTNGFGGDGALANTSILSFPRGITVDSANNIYFCDTGNSRVRRIDAVTNLIDTVAGNGTSGFGGDGGLAINANLSSPTGVAADSAGNIYIADTQNQCIRYLNRATSTITTVAGRPRIPGYGGDKSFATFAFLSSPSHLAFDGSSGYYYIADDGNSRIRYVNSATKIIFTAAGNGSPLTGGDGGPAVDAVFGTITSIATDSNKNIYISDGLGHAIRKIDAVTSTITTIAGTGVGGFSGDGGLATSARVSSPQTIVIDPTNTIFFTDMNNQRVRRIDAINSTISSIVGTGDAGYNGDLISSIAARLNFPKALTRDSLGGLYIGDTQNFRIRRADPAGFITTYAGTGTQGTPTNDVPFISATLGVTNALAVDSQNQLYMADSTTNAIWTFSTNGTLYSMSALSTPAYLGDASPLSNAYFNQPTGLIVDSAENLVICDAGNYRVRRTYTFGNPLNARYINMAFKYTNYFTSTGTAYISLNGNLLSTFNGSSESNLSYTLTDANILDYPLQTSNPVYGNQLPFIEIRQISTFGYAKLEGAMWVNAIPGQGLLNNSVDSNSGIIMNSGTLVFPYQNNGITLDNKYNDLSLRTANYTGSLISASDPALKEDIQDASLNICYTTLASLPLRRYAYSHDYVSTFHTRDVHRLGFLTSEVSSLLPNSISPVVFDTWGNSTFNTLDVTQIKMTHFGVTKSLIDHISFLECEVSTLSGLRNSMRALVAQRNNVL